MTLADAAREYVWLYDQRHGWTVQQLADRDGVSVPRVKRGLERARALDERQSNGGLAGPRGSDAELSRAPRVVPLFPVGPLVPNSECPHRGPIEAGSNFCCMVCHQSGLDGHPALQRDPKTDPPPEPKPATVPMPARRSKAEASQNHRKARRQRRAAS